MADRDIRITCVDYVVVVEYGKDALPWNYAVHKTGKYEVRVERLTEAQSFWKEVEAWGGLPR